MATRKRGRVEKCLFCKKAKAVFRGLCQKDLKAVQRLIEDGETTEEQCIAKGLMLPPTRPGRPIGEAQKKLRERLALAVK